MLPGFIVLLLIAFGGVVVLGLGDEVVDLVDGLDQQGQVVLLGVDLEDQQSRLSEVLVVDDHLDSVVVEGSQW